MKPIVRGFLTATYRPRVIDAEKMPKKGGLLLVANHASFLDPVLIYCYQKCFRRNIRFVADQAYVPKWFGSIDEKPHIYTAYAEELPFENDKVAATPWGFADAIRSGMRPAVPRNCPPEVARLMVLCWDPNPEKRPTFEVIHKFFRSYFEDCFMDKPS